MDGWWLDHCVYKTQTFEIIGYISRELYSDFDLAVAMIASSAYYAMRRMEEEHWLMVRYADKKVVPRTSDGSKMWKLRVRLNLRSSRRPESVSLTRAI